MKVEVACPLPSICNLIGCSCEELIEQFENAWSIDHPPKVRDFLPPIDHPHYQTVVSELIRCDLELNWTHGRNRQLEEFRSEFPSLFHDPSRLAELAFEEYRQRIQAGELVQPTEYQERYGIDVSDWPVSESPNKTVRVDSNPATMNVMDDWKDTIDRLRLSAPELANQWQASQEAMPVVGQRFLSFDLIQELGRGAFGRVYLARQIELSNRLVALKIAPDLGDEPEKLAQLQHTNIMPIFSVHRTGPCQAVCMPYFGSTTLSSIVGEIERSAGSLPNSGRALLSTLFESRKGPHCQTVDETSPPIESPKKYPKTQSPATLEMLSRLSHVNAVLWIGARLADGLAHAHERGILHRDLKPANILLTDDGQPMLLDFNLAADEKKSGGAETARLGGTLPFMAPEHLRAFIGNERKSVDARSDLYSLGVILFKLLTGVHPFEIPYSFEPVRLEKMLAERSAISSRNLNPNVSHAVDSIVRKLLEPDPKNRYSSANQLREDIERHLSNLPLRYARERSWKERTLKWRMRNPRLSTGIGVALAVGLFLILPATGMAIRQSQIAERQSQIVTAEAKQNLQARLGDLRTAQVFLSTQTGDRDLLDRGIQKSKEVLAAYEIQTDSRWRHHPRFARLTEEERQQFHSELGETLILMTCAEILRDPKSIAKALLWNELAETCFPPDQIPQVLVSQRSELVKQLPESERATIPIPLGIVTERDHYYQALEWTLKGDRREALKILKGFTEKHPQHFMGWFVRGHCHDALGHHLEAVSAYSVCVALEPKFIWGYFNRGLMNLKLEEANRAENDFTRVLELHPDWNAALINRGIAFEKQKKWSEAEKDFTQALLQSDVPTRIFFLRSRVRAALNDKDGSEEDRKQGMLSEPTDDISYATRGYVRMDQEPEKALQDFDQALKINPRCQNAYQNKAVVLAEHLHRPADAVTVMNELLQIFPDSLEARGNRGVYHARIGKIEEAKRDAKECLKLDQSPFTLYQMASLYSQLSKYEKTPDCKLESLALLARSLRKGFDDISLLKEDPDLDPIRGEIEFKELLESASRIEKSTMKSK